MESCMFHVALILRDQECLSLFYPVSQQLSLEPEQTTRSVPLMPREMLSLIHCHHLSETPQHTHCTGRWDQNTALPSLYAKLSAPFLFLPSSFPMLNGSGKLCLYETVVE